MTRREIDWRDRGRVAAIGVFMAALVAPAIAVAGAGHARETITVLVNDPASWPAQSNTLRVTTPLWSNAVSSMATLQYNFGTSSDPNYAVMGRDGWMFLGDVHKMNFSQALGRRQMTAEELDVWALTYQAQKEWLDARGIPVLFVVGPAKWGVYPEQLPTWTEGVRQQTIFDQMLEAHPDLDLVDLRPGLRDASLTNDTYPPLNSHWTEYGGYVGWEQLSGEINQVLPAAKASVPALVAVDTRDAQDENEYASMLGIQAPNQWTYPVLASPLPDVTIVNDDGTTRSVPGTLETEYLDMPRMTTSEAAPNDVRALILRDSMSDSLSPYYQSSFDTLWQVRHDIDDPGLAPNIPALVDTFKPDIVIIEMAERYFTMGLPDGAMWQAANAYDRADPEGQRDWRGGVGDVAVSSQLRETGRADLSWTPGNGGGEVLRLSVLADGPGAVTVTVPGQPPITLRVSQGPNVLFAVLPSGTESAVIDSVPGSAGADVTSIELRTQTS